MSTFQGGSEGAGLRICLVVSRFNRVVTEQLEAGALDWLRAHGVEKADVVRVPGAWELPAGIRLAASRGYDGFVALGAVIRGETPHFDYVCQGATAGLEAAGRDLGVPIGFGLLTTDDLEQALQRVGGTAGHKGEEAAEAVVEMCALAGRLR
jgi:6,7-dimethyl-8-ribityllumazine synthase